MRYPSCMWKHMITQFSPECWLAGCCPKRFNCLLAKCFKIHTQQKPLNLETLSFFEIYILTLRALSLMYVKTRENSIFINMSVSRLLLETIQMAAQWKTIKIEVLFSKLFFSVLPKWRLAGYCRKRFTPWCSFTKRLKYFPANFFKIIKPHPVL